MEPPRRLLVATDLSPRAERALGRAGRLAAALQVEHLTVLYVSEEYPPGPPAAARIRAAVEHTLKEQARRLDLPRGVKREVVLASGKPFVEIIRRAREGAADLIVVGAHGAGYLRDLLLGTTAEKVVRKGDRPVLVVKRSARADYRTLLVAVDLSPASREALEFALALAPTASCHLLHVRPALPEHRLALVASSREERVRYRRAELAGGTADLERFLEPLQLSGRRIRSVVRVGRPSECILDAAEEIGADLIAVGTTGRSGLPYILLGSVTEHLMREAACDVLAVRRSMATFTLP